MSAATAQADLNDVVARLYRTIVAEDGIRGVVPNECLSAVGQVRRLGDLTNGYRAQPRILTRGQELLIELCEAHERLAQAEADSHQSGVNA